MYNWRNYPLREIGLLLAAISLLAAPSTVARAQDVQPEDPVYVVQAGDSLWEIAQRFRVSLEDLAAANGLTNVNQLAEGARLVIPGLAGVQGELITMEVAYGESLRSISRRLQVSAETIAKLNRLSSPLELYSGYSLILPSEHLDDSYQRSMMRPSQSLLELSVLMGTSPWLLARANDLAGTWSALPGDVLLAPIEGPGGPGALPGAIDAIEINPQPALQGKAVVLKVVAESGSSFSGEFMGHELHFMPGSEHAYFAIQGVHAMVEPGLYPLTIQGTLADGTTFEFSQNVFVSAVNYPYDRPLTVNPATIDPTVTRPEDAQWLALATPATPEKLWEGNFGMPSPLPLDYCLETGECWTSRFGNRRSYNGGPYTSFHTGLDIAGGPGTEIYAPAAGRVVFAGPLTVRGKATMIDHGWGVYTGYMHQSEIRVKVGDKVEKGQLIGLVGGTGRVEGPHLHWEVWAGGVQVDPLDWLRSSFP